MPSASNKLEKQASIGSVHGTGGGNSGVGGGGASKKSQDVINSNANTNANTVSEINATSNNNVTNNSTNEGSVTSNSNNAKGAIMNPVLEANIPMKQTITTIDHKIRNLEKRKTKLESYRTIQASGKELSADQKAAVAKYDAVISTLEFARELSKQMWQFVKEAEKEQRKQARKDVITRALAETAKIREVLVIQNIMNNFTSDSIRDDFINGSNGAIKLETADLNILQKYHTDTQTKRPESAEDVPFVTSAQKVAELLSMTIDGRPKTYSDNITYDYLRRVFNQIQECGYLDKIYLVTPEPEFENTEEEEEFSNAVEIDDSGNMEESSLEEGMEKLNVTTDEVEEELDEQNVGTGLGDDVGMLPQHVGVCNDLQQQQQHQPQQQQQPQQMVPPQQSAKEHLDVQQQVQANIPPSPQPQHQQQQHQQQQQQQQPNAGVMQPPNAVAGTVPNFQPSMQSAGGGAPVHVAMFTAQQMQTAPPQMQQVPPGSIIGVPQVPPQMVPVAQAPPPQQRQMIASPATPAGGAQIPQGAIPIHGAPQPQHFTPTTVRAVEQGLFPHNRQQFLPQQMRPVAEIIGNGSFYFLQESELDSPELAGNGPMGSVVFEQQQQPPSQQQQQHQPIPQENATQTQMQLQQTNLLNHGNELQAAELHKTQVQHHLQQQQQMLQQQQHQHQQQQQSQSQQAISTQTFTNQSFPPMQTPSSIAVSTNGHNNNNNNSNTPTLASSAPSPMFQQQQQQPQKHPQLFSPVGGPGMQPQDVVAAHQQQLLLSEQQQHQQQQQQQQLQQQPPMMIMARLAGPQTRVPPPNASQQLQQQTQVQQQHQQQQQQQQAQQPQQTLGMQPGEVRVSDVSAVAATGFLGFDNSVVSMSYEQQMQQQLAAVAKATAAAAVAAASAAVAEEKKINEDIGPHNKFNAGESVVVNEWDAISKVNSGVRTGNINGNAVTNVAATVALASALKTGSNVVNVNVGGGSSSSSSGNGNGGGGVSGVLEPPTKWSAEMNALSNPSTPSGNSDNTPTIVRKIEWTSSNSGSGGSGGGYGDGGGAQSTTTSHDSNHWNSNQQQDGGHYNNGRQFQRRRGRGGYGNSQPNGGSRGGIYFRNNDNSSNGSYYQNGGGNVYSNKDSGSRYDSGNYRGPRTGGGGNVGGGGGANGRGNAPPPRTLGGRNSGGGQSNSSSSSYINRSSQRIPMGLDNKN